MLKIGPSTFLEDEDEDENTQRPGKVLEFYHDYRRIQNSLWRPKSV